MTEPNPYDPRQAPDDHRVPLCAGLFGMKRMPDEIPAARRPRPQPPKVGIWL